MKNFQYFLPKHCLSRIAGILANCRIKWIKNCLISLFIKRYKVDMTIAKDSNPLNYVTFNDFFTRELKEIKIVNELNAIVSPSNSKISQLGSIDDHLIFQAKGFKYKLEALLANRYVDEFSNGNFITLYLSPNDYHRIHMPFDGILKDMVYVPGQLFAVNPQTVLSVPNLFTKNERVICIFETSIGLMAVIMIGAMLVGSINTEWEGKVTPNKDKKVQSWRYDSDFVKLSKGDILGHFEMGSTVIVLFQHEKIKWDENLSKDSLVKVGQKIGKII